MHEYDELVIEKLDEKKQERISRILRNLFKYYWQCITFRNDDFCNMLNSYFEIIKQNKKKSKKSCFVFTCLKFYRMFIFT